MSVAVDPIVVPPVIESEDGRLGELRARAAEVSSRFGDEDLARWEERCEFPEALYAALGESGLLGLTVPVVYGGMGCGVREACVVLEELAYGCGVGAAI